MDDRTYLTILYDYYGNLFNDSQKKYFEEYYFNNLSLSEISENYNVSRNAVHKQVKAVEEKLNEYESILRLYKKNIKLNKVLEKLNDEELKKEILDVENI